VLVKPLDLQEMPMSASQRSAFRLLHEKDCFVIPNPWDVGSARFLQHLGFKAVATTSSGHAWTLGRPDNAVALTKMLQHFAELSSAVDVPVSGDFEDGYAAEPEGVAANVTAAVQTGLCGLSIEDSTGHANAPLYDLPFAVERVRAAHQAINGSAPEVILTARAENFLVGKPDLSMTIDRLEAYALAGADCLYAPGLRTKDEIAAVVKAVAPKPVNVLIGAPGLSVAELRDLGVRRVSVGGAFARAAWGEFMRVAQEVAQQGTFESLTKAVSFAELNGFFIRDLKDRGKTGRAN
jgi:methylisocitrate lyase